jgi:hypothetical protein
MAKVNKPPPFDESLAAACVGKYILVGITYLDHEGNETGRQQLHGIIKTASRGGVLIALKGSSEGKTWNMPPDLRCIQKASPGRYRLHGNDETVDDPDLLASWTIQAPESPTSI